MSLTNEKSFIFFSHFQIVQKLRSTYITKKLKLIGMKIKLILIEKLDNYEILQYFNIAGFRLYVEI